MLAGGDIAASLPTLVYTAQQPLLLFGLCRGCMSEYRSKVCGYVTGITAELEEAVNQDPTEAIRRFIPRGVRSAAGRHAAETEMVGVGVAFFFFARACKF